MNLPLISSTQDLRYFNRRRILKALYFNEPLSRQDLSRLTELSVATVTNLLTTWLDQEVILESGTIQSRGGRPRVMLTINKAYGAFIGIDLGETLIRFHLFDLKMNLRQTVTYLLENENIQPAEVIDNIVSGYYELLTVSGYPEEKVIGIGIGVPGVVERKGGISVFAPNWGWHNVPLIEKLEEKIPRPIIMDNGAKAMGLAEQWFGVGSEKQDLVALLVGTGVGAAIIANGELQRGVANSAGEFGHTTLALNGRSCRCGGQGCLETYVGAPGIIQTLSEIAPDSPLLQGKTQPDIMANLASAAESNDKIAWAVIEQTAHYFGAGLANLINLYNPETIVLGGWLSKILGPLLLEKMVPYIEKYSLPQPNAVLQLELSHLGEHSVAMGAASLILGDFLHGMRSSWCVSTGFVNRRPE